MADEQVVDFKPKSLDDVLNATPEPETDPAPAPEPEASKGEEPKAEAEAPSDQDAPPASEDKPKDEPAPEPTTVPIAALMDERHKRQELERRLGEAEKQISEVTQEPRPDPYEDPEGAAAWDRKQAEAQSAQDAQARFVERTETSQAIYRKLHDDYDEIEAIFMEEANKNPALAHQLAQATLPAEFAYEQGKAIKFQREIGGDPAAYEQKVREKLKDELKAELLAEIQGEQKVNVPTSLADTPSAAPREASKWDGPKPIEQLINNKRR